MAKTNSSFDAVQAAKLANFRSMEMFAREAKANHSDIFVFPEYGITGDLYVIARANSKGNIIDI